MHFYGRVSRTTGKMTSWYPRWSRGTRQAYPRRAGGREVRPLTDTSRRILLKTSRRSAFGPRYALADEPRYIETRITVQSA